MKFAHIRYSRYSTWFDSLSKYIDGYKAFDVSNHLIQDLVVHNPEVVFIQSAINFDHKFVSTLRELLPKAKLIGHHNTTYKDKHMKVFLMYDLIFVGMREMKRDFSIAGINTKILLNAFDPLNGLRELPLIHTVLFAGSVYLKPGFHNKRLIYLNELLKNVPTTMRAVLGRRIFNSYPAGFRKANYKAVKAPLLYQEIKSHPIVFNCHADIATEATNMRMFETCGVGSLLLTDYHSNLNNIFKIDEEVLVYRDVKEMIEKALWALDNRREANEIAEAGYKRLLKDHTVAIRSKQFIKEF